MYKSLRRIGLFQKISTHLWTTLNWVPKNFTISTRDSSSLCRIPNPADSESWGIPEFCKIFNGFLGISVKINKILGKFMGFQLGSPSISTGFPMSSMGCVWIFSGIAHSNRRLRKRWRTRSGVTFMWCLP